VDDKNKGPGLSEYDKETLRRSRFRDDLDGILQGYDDIVKRYPVTESNSPLNRLEADVKRIVKNFKS